MSGQDSRFPRQDCQGVSRSVEWALSALLKERDIETSDRRNNVEEIEVRWRYASWSAPPPAALWQDFALAKEAARCEQRIRWSIRKRRGSGALHDA